MYGFSRKGLPCPLMFKKRSECRFIAGKRALEPFIVVSRRVHSPADAAPFAPLGDPSHLPSGTALASSICASLAQRVGKSQLIQFRQKIVGNTRYEHAPLLAR